MSFRAEGPRSGPGAEESRALGYARTRFLAWLVTGPLGRGAAFAADLAALLYRTARRRSPDVRER